jgi:hypothetical protein
MCEKLPIIMFCGLPVMVAVDPTFDAIATASKYGTGRRPSASVKNHSSFLRKSSRDRPRTGTARDFSPATPRQLVPTTRRYFSTATSRPLTLRVMPREFCRFKANPRHAPRHQPSSLSSAFASFRSRVSNPSVNHAYTGASSSRACCTFPWSRQRRARLIAARSSNDFACC